MFGEVDFEVGNFGEQIDQRLGALKVHKPFDHHITDLLLVFQDLLSFEDGEVILGEPSLEPFVVDDGVLFCVGDVVWLEGNGQKLLDFLIGKRRIVVLVAASILIEVLLEEVKLLKLVFGKDFPVDLDLVAVVLLGSVVEDLSGEVVHPLVEFGLVFHVHVAEDVQEVHVLRELIAADHSVLYDRHLLHSDVDEQVPFAHQLQGDEAVEGDALRQQGTNSAGLSARTHRPRGCAVDLRHDVEHLIRIGVGPELAHELVVESNGPECLGEELEGLKDDLFAFDHEEVDLEVLEEREVLVELVLLVVFVDGADVALDQLGVGADQVVAVLRVAPLSQDLLQILQL